MKNAIITILVAIILVLFVMKFKEVSFFDAATVQQEQQKLEELKSKLQMAESAHQAALTAIDTAYAIEDKTFDQRRGGLTALPLLRKRAELLVIDAADAKAAEKMMQDKDTLEANHIQTVLQIKKEIFDQENVVRTQQQAMEAETMRLAAETAKAQRRAARQAAKAAKAAAAAAMMSTPAPAPMAAN